MVNPMTILGAIPLAALTSALYIPLDDDKSGALSATDLTGVQRYVIQNLHYEDSEFNKRDCPEMMRRGHHANFDDDDKKIPKPHGKHHGKPHGKHHEKHLKSHSDKQRELPKEAAPLPTGVVSFAKTEDIIEDSYIVILKKDAHPEALANVLMSLAESSRVLTANLISTGERQGHSLIENDGFVMKHIHDIENGVFRGFSARFFPEVAEELAKNPEVQFVERDSIVRALKSTEEDNAPWGLARLSHRDPLGLSTYNKYLYEGSAGEGVTSYIVDTGIYIDHQDFGGRARWGKTMPAGDTDNDAHGHGSHCAGTIGGSKYGVAKKANLVAVKVLGSDGSGTMSDVIGGVEYVVDAHRREQKEKGSKLKGSTANMSLGGGKSPSLDLAVTAATNAGVHFAVAAGNENQNACNVSPASSEGAITVGATSVRDERAYFSNWGKCVDIFAPGVNVLSVGTSSPSSSAVMSGTSMASPHIAGLLTYFVSLQPSSDSAYATRGPLTTKELKQHLIKFGTSGLLTDLDKESPNVLAFNGGGGDLTKFWQISSQDGPKKHGSLLEKVEHSVENVVDYVGNLLDNHNIADLI